MEESLLRIQGRENMLYHPNDCITITLNPLHFEMDYSRCMCNITKLFLEASTALHQVDI